MCGESMDLAIRTEFTDIAPNKAMKLTPMETEPAYLFHHL